MTEVHCFTSASFAYLDRVRVLAETLRRFHPQWRLWLCQVDRPPPGLTFDPDREGLAGVVDVTALGAVGAIPSLFTHDVVELCTAVKGEMLCHLLSQGAQKVLYIDPDIAVLESLAELEILLDHHDVILTPHQVEPDEEPHAICDNEIGSLKHGVYNLGFLGVAATPDGWRFARWWRNRLLEHCYDDIANGLFTDQRWCDLAPAFFSGLHILRDPGYNVASWNLSRRPISIHHDGRITAAGHTLRLPRSVFRRTGGIRQPAINAPSGIQPPRFTRLRRARGCRATGSGESFLGRHSGAGVRARLRGLGLSARASHPSAPTHP
jgi:hypothetical protein